MENMFNKFYEKSPEKRLEILKEYGVINNTEEIKLDKKVANAMIENYLFNYELPLSVALNFIVDGKEVIVPMSIEEPSVVAAASNGAKTLGNIETAIKEKAIIGQVILTEIEDVEYALDQINKNKESLLEKAREKTQSMIKRGGGPRKVWADSFEDKDNEFISVYFSVDTCDAMGANTINTILESISDYIEEITKSKYLMRIISNNSTESVVKATCKVDIKKLNPDIDLARKTAKRIELATRFANLDKYRAATHNKGIMNGIDAVVLATGNDWRAIEAAAHTYASTDQGYKSLTTWKFDEISDILLGAIELPLPVATVGGTISVHPIAQYSLDIMQRPSARRLASILAAVGLAQNFSAVRAIVTDGIQKGHMSLHARSLATQVGANEDEIQEMVELLKKESKMNPDVAKKLLNYIRERV